MTAALPCRQDTELPGNRLWLNVSQRAFCAIFGCMIPGFLLKFAFVSKTSVSAQGVARARGMVSEIFSSSLICR